MSVRPGLGVALVLGAACLWGTTGTAQTFLSPGVSPIWFGALRLLGAAVFFALVWWCSAKRKGAGQPPMVWMVGAGLCMAAYNLAFFAGVRLTGVALGTALALGSGPIWAGVLQMALGNAAPAPRWWLGMAVAVAGGVAMSLSGKGINAGFAWWGLALCLASGLSYAVYTLISQRVAHQLEPAQFTCWAFGVAAAIAIPAAALALQSGQASTALTARDWAVVAYVAVATAGVAYLLFAHAMRHISAATGVTLALGEPVVAFALAVLVVGESANVWSGLGLLAVVAGVVVVVRSELANTA